MQKFKSPDLTWSSFKNAKTHEEFIQNYVLKARFHSLVPKDIVEDYKIVEYISAYSYFHYPMFDEALRKLLGMFEMALKLKYVSVTSKNWKDRKEYSKKGNLKPNDLNALIDWLCNGKYLPHDKEVYHSIRKIRNYFMHPETSNQGTILFRRKLLDLHNCFNEIFLPKEVLEERKNKLEFYQPKVAQLNKETVHLYRNGKTTHYKLVQAVACLEGRLMLLFLPFCSDIKYTKTGMEHPEELILSIEDFNIFNNMLSGADTKTKKEVFIMPSKQNMTELEVQKTIGFHKNPLNTIHYAVLSKKLNEYFAWESYEMNGTVGVLR